MEVWAKCKIGETISNPGLVSRVDQEKHESLFSHHDLDIIVDWIF